MSGNREEIFFFDGGNGRNLLGVLHLPARAPRLGLVYCHPFAEEKNQSHVIAVRTARRLAAAGCAVLRFDFSGCGDSEGRLEDASAEEWLGEIGRAAEVLRERAGVSRIGLWGLRAGANLAARYARGRSDVALACLWQPLPDLKTYAHQFLRAKLASGMAAGAGEGASVKTLVKQLEQGETVEVMGYPITDKLYRSLAAQAEGPAASAYPFPVCIFSVSQAEAPSDALTRMAEGMRAGDGPARLVHVQAEPFWDRYWRWEAPAVEERAAEWLASVA